MSMLNQSSFLANLAINSESKNLEEFFTLEGGENDQGNSVKKEE